MARPSKARTPEQTDGIAAANVDHVALEDAGRALTKQSKELRTIDMQFALDGDYDLQRIDSMMPSAIVMKVSADLWMGRAFILVKEHESNGTFTSFLERHGITPRAAQKQMLFVRRFSATDQRALMAGKLGASKAMELLSEDDDLLDDLAADGLHGNLTIDDIGRMTRRELRDALRKEREKRADEAEIAETKQAENQARIDKLMGRSRKTGVEDKAGELLAEAMKDFVGASAHLRNFGMTIEQIDAHYAEHGLQVSEDIQSVIDEKVAQVEGFLTDFIAKFGA